MPRGRRRRPARRAAARGRSRPLGRRIVRAGLLGLATLLCGTALLVVPWRFVAPPTTMFMLRESLERRADGAPSLRHRWVPWSQIAPELAVAVVAAEDQKFPIHAGFDFDQIARAVEERGERLRGASTITQQLAKNLYLWSGRSLLRKALEAWFTVWIEATWPKRRILEVYLNVAEMGPGLYGVGAASRAHFGVPPSALSLRQACLLAAVLPSPRRMSAGQPSDYVRERAREIEGVVRSLGGRAYLRRL